MFKSGKFAISIVFVVYISVAVLAECDDDVIFDEEEAELKSPEAILYFKALKAVQEAEYPNVICNTNCLYDKEDVNNYNISKQENYTVINCNLCCINTTLVEAPQFRQRRILYGYPLDEYVTPFGLPAGSIAREKCKEYSQYAEFKYKHPIMGKIPAPCPLDEPINSDGIMQNMQEFQEFPHIVQLGYLGYERTTWSCGGALISENFVLTSAYCVRTECIDLPVLVRAGIINTNYMQIRSIVERITHPKYNRGIYHNIALLKLNAAFELNAYVRPACLYTKKRIPVFTAMATNWESNEDSPDDELVKNHFQVVDKDLCNSSYSKFQKEYQFQLTDGVIEDQMMCVGSISSMDICQHDISSILQIPHQYEPDVYCMYDVVGVFALGTSCISSLPRIYSMVSFYMEWIEEHVWS